MNTKKYIEKLSKTLKTLQELENKYQAEGVQGCFNADPDSILLYKGIEKIAYENQLTMRYTPNFNYSSDKGVISCYLKLDDGTVVCLHQIWRY